MVQDLSGGVNPLKLPVVAPAISANASKVFSLGMLVLECLTLLDGAVTYYNYSTGSIDTAALNRQIKEIED